MATPINAPMAGEIWHLSIEDLFQPVQEAPRLGGDGPFVINLSVSTAPINVPTKAFTNSPLDALVYQIQVTEDGRTRYRLRLGPFASEDEADAILAEVRDTYPGALTATASASDLRVIATMQAKADNRPSVQRQADLVVEKSVSQKIAAEKAAPEVAVSAAPQTATQTAASQTAKQHTAKPQTTTPAKAVPPKAAVPEGAVNARAEGPEISIDIAWPTPELGVPPSMPLRAAPATPAPAAIESEPPLVAAPVSTKLQWALPELDVPLPTIQKPPAAPVAPVAPVAPIAKKAAASAPAPVPFELQLAPPYSTASLAPVLTEVVTPTRSPAPPKTVAPKPAVIAAPVLTEAVAPKIKAPPPVAPAAPAPVAATPAAGPLQALATPEIAPTSKQEMAPPPKKTTAPPPKQTMAPPPKPAAPQSSAPAEPAKTAPVLKQSVASPRRSWAKFRNSISKPAASKLTSLQHVVVATAPVPAPREVKKLDEPLESLESTQTIRALTPKELEDNEASRWFVIQLALADHAFDPDAVPNLDIFSEYRLYSVAGLDQGRVVHALRLGFFREEIGAVAVASYLAAYWDKPTIKRVSLAERERFADQRVEARKDIGATGKHAVIEITDELVARRRRSTKTSAASKASNRPI
jgi:SPOR domain